MTKITPATAAANYAAQNDANVPNQQNGKIIVFVNNGKGAEQPKRNEYNLFGKDLENFEKFKKNDRHDAMRLTNSTASDVKKAYMQLQHEFPDVFLEFEPMPDPKKCGKGREGFFTYQQQLAEWKDFAIRQIENAREASFVDTVNEEGAKTRHTVKNAAEAVMANDDLNTAVILANQEDNTEELKDAIKQDGAHTRATVKKESEANQLKTEQEGKKTRDAVFIDGAMTRVCVENEHNRTNEQVRKSAEDTQYVVKDEAEKTRENSNENRAQIEDTVKKEAEKTREKVQEAIEIDDPTGTKRAIHNTKKLLRDNKNTIIGGLLLGTPGAIIGSRLDND